MSVPLCSFCNEVLDNHGTCWSCEEQQREQAAYLASAACLCGEIKAAGESLCGSCVQAEEAALGRDHEAEERHERLMKCLPDGDYTASEMAEYLS